MSQKKHNVLYFYHNYKAICLIIIIFMHKLNHYAQNVIYNRFHGKP
jgi:hypothetical protein